MKDLSFTDMFQMQRELWDKHKDSWSPLEPEFARNSLLWMMSEIGEVIDIIKKCGEAAIMTEEGVRTSFIEELCDVLMYFNDAMLRYGIDPEDIALAYVKKHEKNMNRSFQAEVKAFTNKLKKNSE